MPFADEQKPHGSLGQNGVVDDAAVAAPNPIGSAVTTFSRKPTCVVEKGRLRYRVMNKKLSICIATRNRGEFIGETLRSIVDQCDERVEIVVIDGASTDNTEAVVIAVQGKHPGLRYVKLATNGGVDRDFDIAVENAVGEYCWLMSDDDLLKPGAIDKVLGAIDKQYSLIVVNSEVRTFDFSILLDRNRLRFDADRLYKPADFGRLFEETSGYLSYIGAVVIRRDIWMERDRETYYGSWFIHVGVIFQAVLPADTFVIAEPLISIRFGNAQWRPKEFHIRMICWTNLVWSLPAIPEALRAKCYRREPWRNVKSLVFFRAKGTYDLSDYRTWIRPRVHSAWDKAKAIAVACIPGPLANLIGLIYCSFEYRDSNIHLLDMKASRFYYKNWLAKPQAG
jgi:glycosyltransferase involved in cell wall biosynthesis